MRDGYVQVESMLAAIRTKAGIRKESNTNCSRCNKSVNVSMIS